MFRKRWAEPGDLKRCCFRSRRRTGEYIEMFYNNQRLHAYLDYVSPALLNGYRCRKRLKPLSTFPGSYHHRLSYDGGSGLTGISDGLSATQAATGAHLPLR